MWGLLRMGEVAFLSNAQRPTQRGGKGGGRKGKKEETTTKMFQTKE